MRNWHFNVFFDPEGRQSRNDERLVEDAAVMS